MEQLKLNLTKKIMKTTQMGEMVYAESLYDKISRTKIISSANGFKGFKINEDGILIGYSDLYNVYEYEGFNIRPFKHGDTYYAIVVNKEDKYGIIDTSGNVIEGFNFNFDNLLYNIYAQDKNNPWFFVADNDLWSLKSF